MIRRSQWLCEFHFRRSAPVRRVSQNCGQNSARTAGRGSYYLAAGGVLFADCVGVGANEPVFARLRALVHVAAVVEHISLSHYAESAGQLALGGKSALDAAVHDDPHAVEIMPDSFALESFNQVGNTDIFFLAVFFYLREILERGRLRAAPRPFCPQFLSRRRRRCRLCACR